MADAVQPTQNLWAVIQTGAITKDADIIAFKDASGNRVPAVLFIHADKAKVDRMRKRILSRNARIDDINADNTVPSTPILGIVQVTAPAPIKRPRKPKPDAANGTVKHQDASAIPAAAKPGAKK